jgi:hypothetical protein
MSVKVAVAKLCACACGGAIVGTGAVQVANAVKPAFVRTARPKPATFAAHTSRRAKAPASQPRRILAPALAAPAVFAQEDAIVPATIYRPGEEMPVMAFGATPAPLGVIGGGQRRGRAETASDGFYNGATGGGTLILSGTAANSAATASGSDLIAGTGYASVAISGDANGFSSTSSGHLADGASSPGGTAQGLTGGTDTDRAAGNIGISDGSSRGAGAGTGMGADTANGSWSPSQSSGEGTSSGGSASASTSSSGRSTDIPTPPVAILFGAGAAALFVRRQFMLSRNKDNVGGDRHG